jgi:hypothetical protein
MNVSVLRLGFAVFWLALAMLLFLRRTMAPDGAAERLGFVSLDVAALLAVVLSLWNFARWYMGRSRPPAEWPVRQHRRPLEPRRDSERVEEYNPEFDFTRQSGTESGGGQKVNGG